MLINKIAVQVSGLKYHYCHNHLNTDP